MYKLKSSRRDSGDSSIGFHRNIEVRERELTNNKTTKQNYHVRIYLKDVFGFAEHQGNCSYGLCYKIKLQRNIYNHLLSHRAGAKNWKKFCCGWKIYYRGCKSVSSALYSKYIKSEINHRIYCI